MLTPPGGTAAFLAALPVAELAAEPALASPQRVELVDLLRRLGLVTIGDFAALDPRDVASRFGADAVAAHRSARGLPERTAAARTPPPDLEVEHRCDPPVDRVDAAAFVARGLAERLHAVLGAAGVACTRLLVRARTEHGEELTRTWRCAEPLTPAGTADRVRWQLDGWLSGRSVTRPSAGVSLLRLEPVEVVAAGALQLGLWGGVGEGDDRARRTLVRVQGLLGGDAVLTAVRSGGRGPGEQLTLRSWGDELVPAADPAAPWPGRLPAPAPGVVPEQPRAARVLDEGGAAVGTTDRGELTAEPATVVLDEVACPVLAWAGPWPVLEHWWDPERSRRADRVQAVVGTGGMAPGGMAGTAAERAVLLVHAAERWWVEGCYD